MNLPRHITRGLLAVGVFVFVCGVLTFGWNADTWQWMLWAGISVAVVWLLQTFAYQLFGPIDRFRVMTRRVSSGDYEGLMGVHGFGQPWSQLAEEFEAMRIALRNREGRLKDTNQRMESVLGSMIEGVLAVDGAEKVILFNREAKRMLGVSQVDVIGRSLRELVRIPELNQAVAQAIAAQETVHSEFTTSRTPRRVLSLRATPLPDDFAEGLTIVLEDVTELRHLENLRRDFVANVSHELKTPLTAIKAYAETLRLGAIHDPENCIGFIEQIETQSERLHQLIIDLIRLAQVESGETAFEISDVDVGEICRASATFVKDEAEQRQITLAVELGPNQLLAKADADGVRTIVDNLMTNAIRYTMAQGQVSIRCFRQKGWIMIEVADTGIGIAPEHVERIFERFYRADKARSRDVGGTGLGLSIVKHLAQSFGGAVEVTSQVGQGSQFRVRLPVGASSRGNLTPKS